ncbi:uncharacterized protein LTR77_010741 [Saxophila tyrrhenica]|uniref:RNA-dependent RNA polymerase n=1 Tax=Saxophila tyrrhenica TaxID=1690608 RepID=A0AAV9NUK5_9PEZI|nr:hypothetical protein LTR77_010741 [Saxophila tyrrhenica]
MQPTARPPQVNNRNHMPPGQSILRQAVPWAGNAEAIFIMRGAPPGGSIPDIYRLLQPHGNIVFIEILASRQANRTEAEVKFRPPPHSAEWYANGIDINKDGTVYHISFAPKEPRPWFHASPVDPNRKFAEEIKLPMMELSFGVMQKPDSMQGLNVIQASESPLLDMVMNLQRKCLDIHFSLNQQQTPCSFKLRVNFAQLEEVIQMRNETTGQICLKFTAELPPQLFQKINDVTETFVKGDTRWTDWQTWYRQTEIEHDPEAAKEAVTQLRKQNPVIDVGRWLTYCLVFDRTAASSLEFQQFCLALTHHNVDILKDRKIEFASSDDKTLWKWLDDPDAILKQNSASLVLHQMAEDIVHFDFDIRYQLEVCISHGLIHESNIDNPFLSRLAKLDAVRAVKLLEKVADEMKRFWDPISIFRQLLARVSVVQKKLPPYCAIVHSAIVTPTTIYFSTPVMETSNRVIRQYSKYADRFLRVKFNDELYKGGIRSFDSDRMKPVFNRIEKTMVNGIRVGGRHFEFLAFGNSQFREAGAWFFASTSEITAQSIRDWMGNFSDINVVAKYCSRVGQCFSTTRAFHFGDIQVKRIPDIKRNGHMFTDGVGKISPFLAQMIANQHNLPNPTVDYPSMFQFRLGGSKGVLTVDPSLTWKSVHIRPSQEKFSSKHHADLNICRMAQFSMANLNIQIILVLSALGVIDEVFLRKMSDELSDLNKAMTDSEKAVELLCKNVDFNQMTLQLASMVEDGFLDVKDPFTISCMRLWHSWTVKYLKEKAKIPVRDGAFVLGCVDETATLQGHCIANEGSTAKDIRALPQIFIQVPDPDQKGKWKVITGVCTLARNPSLHPGDVRVVNAVDIPQLRHLRNCVVLPQLGERGLASMCSGGDLDGDDYLLMWDKDLLPEEWNHSPMNYDAPDPVRAAGPVTVKDMTEFFVNHMKHDNLRPIAVAHKYWADRQNQGVKSPICLELAQLHSMAVDYAKTGVAAEFEKRLRVQMWPHWAEVKGKSQKYIYQSRKVIGKLYDMVHRVNFRPAWEEPFDRRILDAFELDDALLESAREAKQEYDAAVRRIMAKFGIKSDFEVFTTFALEHSDDFGDYKFAETLGEVVGALKDHHQKLCYERAGTTDKERDQDKIARFAAAMYTVTSQEVAAAVEECKSVVLRGGRQINVKEAKVENMPFMSFPWLFAAELGRIANKGKNSRKDSLAETMVVPRKVVKMMPVLDLGDDFELEPLEEVVLPATAGATMPTGVATSVQAKAHASNNLRDLQETDGPAFNNSPEERTPQASLETRPSSSEGLNSVQPQSSGRAPQLLSFDNDLQLEPLEEATLSTIPSSTSAPAFAGFLDLEGLDMSSKSQALSTTHSSTACPSSTSPTAPSSSLPTSSTTVAEPTMDVSSASSPLDGLRIAFSTPPPPPTPSPEDRLSFSRTAASPPSSSASPSSIIDDNEREGTHEHYGSGYQERRAFGDGAAREAYGDVMKHPSR